MNEKKLTTEDQEKLKLIVQQYVARLKRANSAITAVGVSINHSTTRMATSKACSESESNTENQGLHHLLHVSMLKRTIKQVTPRKTKAMNEQKSIIEDRENLELIVQQCIKRLIRANKTITGVFVTINLKSPEIAHKGEFSMMAHCETTVDVPIFNNVLFVLKPSKSIL